MRQLKVFASTILLASLACSNLFAQATAGLAAITGIVADESGSTVPGAQVIIENKEKGIRRDLETNGAGIFSAPGLQPTSGYSIKVSKPGFATFENNNFPLQVGQVQNFPVVLSVKVSTDVIQVTDTGAVVDDTKVNVSQVVNAQQIRDLPINGRRVDSFVLLTPGVTNDGQFGLLSFRGIAGGNAFLTDGNDTTQQFYNENSGRTRANSAISQDVVQEFQVLTSSYSAEYGRAIGGVVNTVTRSGGNGFHGTAYDFFRNRTLNARDRFAQTNPPEVRNQVGGTISGPIIKDKLFFLVNTEETRRVFPLVANLVNANAIQNGRWVGCGVASNGNPAASDAQCNAINAIIPNYVKLLPRRGDQDLLFGKIDYQINAKNTLSLSFNYQRFISPSGIQTAVTVTNGNAFASNGNDSTRVRYGRAALTTIVSNNIVNEFRFGWFKDRQADDINQSLLQPGIGGISLTVLTLGLGAPNYVPRILPSESKFQLADNLSWTIGRHNVKVGVDYTNTEEYTFNLIPGNGSYNYNSANAFALDFSGPTAGGKRYQQFQQAFGNPVVNFNINDIAAYVQDTYKVNRKLTIDAGLRYEKAFLPTPPLSNPRYPQTGRIPETNLNFGPRIGFAYSLNDKTVVRGGYGLFWGRYQGALIQSLFLQNSVYQTTITLNGGAAAGPSYPNILPNAANAVGASTIGFADRNLRTPYTEQGSIALERSVTRDVTVTANYIWSRGISLTTVDDINVGKPTSTATYNILQSVNGPIVGSFTTPVYTNAGKVDPTLRSIFLVNNRGKSYYNALALQVNKRFARGFQGSISYTWAHAIDTNIGNAGGNLFFASNSPNSVRPFDYNNEKGDSALDQRHRVVFTFIARPVFTKRTDWFSRYLVNNWELSGIGTFAQGQPQSPTVNVSSGPADRINTGTLSGYTGSNRVPFLPVNSLRNEDIERFDARLTKVLPLSERIRVSLNFEVFNLTNSQYGTGLFSTAYNTTNPTFNTTTNVGTLAPAPGAGTANASGGSPDGTNARRAQASVRVVF